ncbi:hypothetical protein [Actinoplanes sp. NPDC020271]|uniref:hypothetical protein n=1 Tax=Actinoplanes sp. NPDC020271 TaxID=3363896 RepID=UPI0037AB288D
MSGSAIASGLIEQEARALLTRLARVRPFALHETMVPAAAPAPAAQVRIERFLIDGRAHLGCQVVTFLRWMRGPGRQAPVPEKQRRLTLIRLRFNDVLSQFDLFTEVITQRSEHETGVWLSGLDVLARDALGLPGGYFEPPPVICYLARGPGAAIRRARTRLPGGDENPVAIVRVPRERMVGHGIGASLVHEVGHQGAALLDLVPSLQPVLAHAAETGRGADRDAWPWFGRWISEVVADLWAVAQLGIGAPMGLIGVVSLPRWFVFRFGGEDPHPVPWIRVLLSCALGDALYPDPQWRALADAWRAMYPPDGLDAEHRALLDRLVEALPAYVDLLLAHRPGTLRGARLGEVLRRPDRTAGALLRTFGTWRDDPGRLYAAAPSVTFAALGQARAAGRLTPERESRMVGDLLTQWALRSTLDTSAICAGRDTTPALPLRVPLSIT